MRIIKFAAPVAILYVGFVLSAGLGLAKVDYAKKEKKGCVFCHVKQGSKELNEAGQYYKEHKNSLEGYTPKK